MGQGRVKCLKASVDGILQWQRGIRWSRLNSGTIQAGGAQTGRHSGGRCRTSRRSRGVATRTAPGVIAAESFESGQK